MKSGSLFKLRSIRLHRQKSRIALHGLRGEVEATATVQRRVASHTESLIAPSPHTEVKEHPLGIYEAAQVADIRARAQGQCLWHQM